MDNILKEGLELFLDQNSQLISNIKKQPVDHLMYGVKPIDLEKK